MTDDDARLRAIWTSDARMPCACRKCAPNIYPRESFGARRGEGHASVRFGDYIHTSIYLDDVELLLCVEAFADTSGDGWVIEGRHDRPHHICQHVCPSNGHVEPCESVRYGRARIQRDNISA